LSHARATASADYIKERITNPHRITAKGFGELQLANGCACEGETESGCSEADHRLNRRSEFIVIKNNSPASVVER
jgi:outer membrane protein OmpA-like peptidoglycan-associated protein